MSLQVETYYPGDLLKPFVKNYHVVMAINDVNNYVVPDVAPVMIFRFRGQLRLAEASAQNSFPLFAVSGLRTSARMFSYLQGSCHIVVRLKEGFANVFFDEAVHEFYQNSVPFNSLSRYNDLALLEDQLSSASSNSERILRLEEFLISHLRIRSIDAMVVSAVNQIVRSNGDILAASLAKQHHLSLDAFEKRFRRVVGAPPKRFAKIVRLKTLIAKGIEGKSLTELSIDAGYFDQPHFNNEFKLFTGRNPSQFFQQKQRW